MGSYVRTLLILLLVLAVPVQAAAAVTMSRCGPNHHRGGPVEQRAVAEHAHHGSAAQTPHRHEGVAAQPDADEATAVSASTAAPAKLIQPDEHKCSACASCCSGGAIFSTMPAVPAPEISSTVFIADVARVDAFAVSGPDRPPRIFLA
jgi:hypothetical protein